MKIRYPQVKDFKGPNEFIQYNKGFIYGNSLFHLNLIQVIKKATESGGGISDAFNIIGPDDFILALKASNIWLIYDRKWSATGINILYDRIGFGTPEECQFMGPLDLLTFLFAKKAIPHQVYKERIVYQCKTVKAPQKKVPGQALTSDATVAEEIARLTYDYSLAEWGERPDRTVDYYREQTRAHIDRGDQYHWSDEGKICCIALIFLFNEEIPIIGSLFTPIEYRQKGFATSLVHELTSRLLNNGWEKVGLQSDKSNVGANKAFRQIGFRPIDELIIIDRH